MPLRIPTARAKRMLSALPPFYEQDDTVIGVFNAMGNEQDRLHAFGEEVRRQLFPQNSDDSLGVLGWWESLFDLPVQASNATVEQRRTLVLAHLRKRASGSGLDWEDAATTALGTLAWTYEEGPGDYTVTITYPYAPGTFTSVQVQGFIRKITPAHIQLLAAFSQGWLIGISLIGDPL